MPSRTRHGLPGGRLARSTGWVIIVSLAFLGCDDDKRPDRYPGEVTGSVTLDGRPLEFGTLTFLPSVSEVEGGRPAIARIESDGTFRVGNANPTKPPGLKPGEYVVTVLAMSPVAEGNGVSARMESPDQYADYRTSPLRASIIEGENVLHFELRSRAVRTAHSGRNSFRRAK